MESLGPCLHESPIGGAARAQQGAASFADDHERIVFELHASRLQQIIATGQDIPTAEIAGPREQIYFDPSELGIAVVTCGGLCPGLNNVIRAVTMEAYHRYGVRRIYGVPFGFQGFIPEYGHTPVMLTPQSVAEIHTHGGTFLGSSRGKQDADRIVDWLQQHRVGILVVIGGDGSQRGAMDIHSAITRRRQKIAVVGVPKTIDNDMVFLDKSFGFETAFSKAVDAIACAHTEAKGAPNGIGLVKLMGRESGFIACHAAMSSNDVNFVLIPEVPVSLEGERGFLKSLEKRLKKAHHAVVLVAEGAGQHWMSPTNESDASGNQRFGDIGLFMKARIEEYFKKAEIPVNLKYIDPSYIIRGVPANAQDALYCSLLGQNAVHAGMSGRTGLVVGRWYYHYVHLPAKLVTSHRRRVAASGELWQSVLASTGQPAAMKA